MSIFSSTVLYNLVAIPSTINYNHVFFALIGIVAGLLYLWSGVKTYRKGNIVSNTVTEKVRSMTVGRTELQGIARPHTETHETPFTGEDCLYAAWKIEEYRDRSGNDNKNWDTIASGSYWSPFILDDGTGEVLVDTESDDPTWTISEAHEQTYRDSFLWNLLSFTRFVDPIPKDRIRSFKNSQNIGSSSNSRRYTQEYLPVECDTYVLGEATARDVDAADIDVTDAGERLKIVRDKGSGEFIVSDKDEEDLAKYYSRRGRVHVIGSSVVLLFSTFVMLSAVGVF